MSKLWTATKRYWNNINSSIFQNYKDALAGLVVLTFLPFISLLSVILANSAGFWAYTFPVISIGFAGAYDSYGRYRNEENGVKVGIRITLDLFACIIATVVANYDCVFLKIIPPALLLISGLLIVFEVYIRVSYALQMSPWWPID